jgi:hypothetical protein
MTTRKRQTVLKDFSQLKPIDERIEILASSISKLHFKGEALDDFKPRSGTQTERVWRMNKLDDRQQIAWRYFCDDMVMAKGKSGGVCGGYGEYTDKGNDSEFKRPVAYANQALLRLEHLLMDYLDRRERALLSDLAQDYLRGNSSLTLEAIGLIRSGYKDKVSARAAGVVHVQLLMSRLATYYRI